MLEEIHVRNMALIEEVWIQFGPGMTVLTGETGTGKTALVGALKLLVGERADSGMVRSGTLEALVEGRFVLGDVEVVARRKISADGRSRCTIDGSMATVGELATVLGPVVDLHGQHEHQSLLTVARHAGYLDRYIGEEAVRAAAAYREARGAYREASEEVERLQARLAEVERHADHLRFVLDDISAADPTPGEDEELEQRLPALTHSEKLAASGHEAAACLRGEGGAADMIGQALEALRRVSGLDAALDAITARIDGLSAEIDDAGSELRAYAQAVEHDPAALDAAQARLAVLSGLKKRYGPSLELVLAARDEARDKLAAADSGEEELQRARDRVATARAEFERAANVLGEVRRAAVDEFTGSLAEAIAGLNMGGARFEVAFEPLGFESWGPDGPDRVEFLFAPAAGEQARPLAKIASGGEMSRVMLALKSVLGEADDVPVLVFDEVDAGIGGVTGLAIGARLAELAAGRQVIVVTHLPQVAAFANHHLVVDKAVVDGRTVTTVEPVEGQARVSEIARMLSGVDSDASLTHAAELLDQVSRARSGVAG